MEACGTPLQRALRFISAMMRPGSLTSVMTAWIVRVFSVVESGHTYRWEMDFSFIMSDMARLMKNFSSVAGLLERKVAELERMITEQNNTIEQHRLNSMEKAATP